MADDKHEDPSGQEQPLRRSALTPEQRRFLQTPKHREPSETPGDAAEAPGKPGADPAPPSHPEPTHAKITPRPRVMSERRTEPAEGEKPAVTSQGRPAAGAEPRAVGPDKETASRSAFVTVAFLIGGLVLLAAVFYVGKRFDYWRYQFVKKYQQPDLAVADKFPDKGPDQLIEEAFAAERERRWSEAVDLFIAAKKKNLFLRGVLYRVGRISFNLGELVGADAAFERAIAFGEDVHQAQFSRGLIALRRNDFPTAHRFFAAAAETEPLTAEYHYFAGEALRMEEKPSDAIPWYRQAAARATSEQDLMVCQYKIRLARLEAGETGVLEAALGEEKAKGTLSIDWLLTEAALRLRENKINEAIRLIEEARSRDQVRLFRAGANDLFFRKVAGNNPALAEAIKFPVEQTPTPPPGDKPAAPGG